MNFKPTLWKSIVSVVISIIIGLYYSTKYYILDGSPSFTTLMSDKIAVFILYSIIVFIPVYVIWSLFQKKR